MMADIRDREAVRSACEGARFVFHLAAIYRFWAKDPGLFNAVNVGGTINVPDAVPAAGCERPVFTSTVRVLLPRRARHVHPTHQPSQTHLSHPLLPPTRTQSPPP